MNTSLEEIEVYSAIVFYASLKTIADILSYIKNFTDAKLIFDKRSVDKIYVTKTDPRTPRKENPK